MNKRQLEKFQTVQATILNWQRELEEYKQWAIDNAGILDENEQAEIDKRIVDISLISDHINKLLAEDAVQTEYGLSFNWEKALQAALLAPEIKAQIKAIFEKIEDIDDEKACETIVNISKFYELHIRGQKESNSDSYEAAKAALIDSIKQEKENWNKSSCNVLFNKYLEEGGFEQVELSNPRAYSIDNNLTDIGNNTLNTPPTIIVPISSNQLAKKGLMSFSLEGGFKISFKKDITLGAKSKVEDEARKWATEQGVTFFNSSVSALGDKKNSTTAIDIDLIKGAFDPMPVNVRLSGGKLGVDNNSMDVTFLSFSVSSEIKNTDLVLDLMGGEVPTSIGQVSLSFRLAFSIKKEIGITEQKALKKVKDVLEKRRTFIEGQGESLYERAQVENEIKRLKENRNNTPDLDQELKKKQKELQKLQKKYEKFVKLQDKADKAIGKLKSKITSKVGKIASSVLTKNAAKFAAKAVGRFIPGVNVALLVWDAVEIGIFVYNWYNQKDKKQLLQEMIKKQPVRTQSFLNTLLDKYGSIPNVGDDIDKLNDYLEGLDPLSFERLIGRLESITLPTKSIEADDAAPRGLSDAMFKNLDRLAAESLDLSEEEEIHNLSNGSLSLEVKNKGTDLRVPTKVNVGDKIPAIMHVDLLDPNGQVKGSYLLKDKNILYVVIQKTDKVLKVDLITNNSKQNSFDFEVVTHKVFLKAETRYWHLEQRQWVYKDVFDASKTE